MCCSLYPRQSLTRSNFISSVQSCMLDIDLVVASSVWCNSSSCSMRAGMGMGHRYVSGCAQLAPCQLTLGLQPWQRSLAERGGAGTMVQAGA